MVCQLMAESDQLETDYLVIGAGAVGMAFVDALMDDPEVDVIMVDRRSAPGGHWLDAYPFVQLHQPAANYGVNSTALGHDRIDLDGPNAGFHELATGPEICGYFDDVMRHRLLPSGRVRFFAMSEYLGDRRFRSLLTGQVSEVVVRRRVVDATYMASRVPATEPPPFEVAAGVQCLAVGDLVGVADPPAGYVVIGGGKTAMDACTWLLGHGTPPESVTWIRPRESWVLNRAKFQPGPGAMDTFEGAVLVLEAVATSGSVEETFEQLERAEVMLRLEPERRPTMVKGATLSDAEVDGLRQIDNVVRLGHVQRIERDRIVLDEGSIPTSPEHLHIHCAAPGLALSLPRPIFTDDTITLQCIARLNLTLSAALTGYLETTDRSMADKNRLLSPNPFPDTPFDYLRAMVVGMSVETKWADQTDVQRWLADSRLNVLKDLPATEDRDRLQDLQGRFLTAISPALTTLHELAAKVTPAERERMLDPALTEDG
jgi:hypothetical protein